MCFTSNRGRRWNVFALPYRISRALFLTATWRMPMPLARWRKLTVKHARQSRNLTEVFKIFIATESLIHACSANWEDLGTFSLKSFFLQRQWWAREPCTLGVFLSHNLSVLVERGWCSWIFFVGIVPRPYQFLSGVLRNLYHVVWQLQLLQRFARKRFICSPIVQSSTWSICRTTNWRHATIRIARSKNE